MISSASQTRVIDQASLWVQPSFVVEQVAMRATTSGTILRVRQCRACNAVFYVCCSCDRGQRYCCQECRAYARKQQLHAANRRYQCSEAGRQAHQKRQRQYRWRCTGTRVTDQGSRPITTPSLHGPAKPLQCAVCARIRRWVDPFPTVPLPQLLLRRSRRVGKSSKNYVFR